MKNVVFLCVVGILSGVVYSPLVQAVTAAPTPGAPPHSNILGSLWEFIDDLLDNLNPDVDNPLLSHYFKLQLLGGVGGRRKCPANKIFKKCGGCITKCEDRYNPKPCHAACTPKCVCHEGTFWNGKFCVKARYCPLLRCNCGRYASCRRSHDGRPICHCNRGYAGDGRNCRRIATTAIPCRCGPQATCTREGNGYPMCRCNAGYSGNGRFCSATHHPTAIPHIPCQCHNNAHCTRHSNGYPVCNCNQGFHGNGLSCNLIARPPPRDPCSDCHEYATCHMRGNSQIFCLCNIGYAGDGRTCTDIRPTQRPQTTFPPCRCPQYSTCNRDYNGIPTCKCNQGYQDDGQGGCSAINNTPVCNPRCSSYGVCINHPHGNLCQCEYGYEGIDCSRAKRRY